MASSLLFAQADASKTVVVLPFESGTEVKPGFLEASRSTVVASLKKEKLFADVQSADDAPAGALTLSAKLLLFQPGTRTMVWMDHGRARATFQFTLRDSTGKTLWQDTIKRDAFAWSDNPAAPSQRRELPEKVAAALVKKLKDRR